MYNCRQKREREKNQLSERMVSGIINSGFSLRNLSLEKEEEDEEKRCPFRPRNSIIIRITATCFRLHNLSSIFLSPRDTTFFRYDTILDRQEQLIFQLKKKKVFQFYSIEFESDRRPIYDRRNSIEIGAKDGKVIRGEINEIERKRLGQEFRSLSLIAHHCE